MAIRKVSSARKRRATRTANPSKRRRRRANAGTSAGAKKAWATRRKKAAARSRAAKKAAATRKRNANKRKRAGGGGSKPPSKTTKRRVTRRKRAYSATRIKGRVSKGAIRRRRKYKGRVPRSSSTIVRRKSGKVIRVRVKANPTHGLFGIKLIGGVDVAAAVVGTLTASVFKNVLENMKWSKDLLNKLPTEAQPFAMPVVFTGLAVVAHKTKLGKKLPAGVKTALTWAAAASIVLAVHDYADKKIADKLKEMGLGADLNGGYHNYGGAYKQFSGAYVQTPKRLSGGYVQMGGGSKLFGGITNAA